MVEEPATGGGGIVGWSLGFCSATKVSFLCVQDPGIPSIASCRYFAFFRMPS